MTKLVIERTEYVCSQCGEIVSRKITEPIPTHCPFCQSQEHMVEIPPQLTRVRREVKGAA